MDGGGVGSAERAWSKRLVDVEWPEDVGTVEHELRAVAKDNALASAPRVRRAAWRTRIAWALVAIATLAALAWVAGNAWGFYLSDTIRRPVTGSATSAEVAVARGTSERADCWQTGAVTEVWKAGPPFVSVVPYRCGDGPVAMVASGPISGVAAAGALVGSIVLVTAKLRRRRSNWY
jgi:hypothetical protein